MTASDYQNLVKLCQALDEHGVEYLVFGSFAGRLQGADLETVDVDLVPERSEGNLGKLCDALNSLRPRWRVEDSGPGVRIDGGRLEARHILGSSVALGVVTEAGLIDIGLEPRGYERGYNDLIVSAVTVPVGGSTVLVGSLSDLIRSKELLGREKDRTHLPSLLERQAEIERLELIRGKYNSRGDDLGPGLSR